jgi:hypothetical protein
MRCVGAENPPCARCFKSNRECNVRLPNRQQTNSSTRSKRPFNRHIPPRSPTPTTVSPRTAYAERDIPTTTQVISPAAAEMALEQSEVMLSESELPSIFSSTAITMGTRRDSDTGSQNTSLNTRNDQLRLFAKSDMGSDSDPISRSVIHHLGEL